MKHATAFKASSTSVCHAPEHKSSFGELTGKPPLCTPSASAQNCASCAEAQALSQNDKPRNPSAHLLRLPLLPRPSCPPSASARCSAGIRLLGWPARAVAFADGVSFRRDALTLLPSCPPSASPCSASIRLLGCPACTVAFADGLQFRRESMHIMKAQTLCCMGAHTSCAVIHGTLVAFMMFQNTVLPSGKNNVSIRQLQHASPCEKCRPTEHTSIWVHGNSSTPAGAPRRFIGRGHCVGDHSLHKGMSQKSRTLCTFLIYTRF